MAEALKVLGQQADPTSETALYAVPASTEASASTICICNRTSNNRTARVAVVPGGGAAGNANWIYYDLTVPKNQSIFATIGITLATTDEVRVQCDAAGLSFSLFGVEVS